MNIWILIEGSKDSECCVSQAGARHVGGGAGRGPGARLLLRHVRALQAHADAPHAPPPRQHHPR